jgi:hypothetical protein
LVRCDSQFCPPRWFLVPVGDISDGVRSKAAAERNECVESAKSAARKNKLDARWSDA